MVIGTGLCNITLGHFLVLYSLLPIQSISISILEILAESFYFIKQAIILIDKISKKI